MAIITYGNKYKIYWEGVSGVTNGWIYLDLADYVGSVSQLRIRHDSLNISYLWTDYDEHIMGMQCEFSIVNEKSNFFDLMELMTAEERQWKIRVVQNFPSAYTMFEGFLNCDVGSQKYLHRQEIKLLASSYLSKLENDHPTSIDTLQKENFISIIDQILRTTGGYYNIRINSTLHEEGDFLSAGQTLFSKNGFFTEIFWEDNVKRLSSLDILKKILTSFDCFIYWFRGYWYIERYEDIWTLSTTFIEYATGAEFPTTYSGTTVALTKIPLDVHSLKFAQQSQTIGTIPGLKTITINLDEKRLNNLIRPDLTDAEIIENIPFPQPTLRNWMRYEYPAVMTWDKVGEPKGTIAIAARRTIPLLESVLTYTHRGLCTAFRVTVDDITTKLTIKFKYCAEKVYANDSTWADYSIIFNWYLQVTHLPNTEFITQSGDDWNKKEYSSVVDALQFVEASGADMDKTTDTMEVSIDIPIGAVKNYVDGLPAGTMKGDYILTFCAGAEIFRSEIHDDFTPYVAWFGDFSAETTGGIQNNVIEGTISTKFLNKKQIGLLLYDMENYNYKNGILRGSALDIRTERWGTVGGEYQIVERGVCYGTSHNPTTSDQKAVDPSSGFGSFECTLTGLAEGYTYYTRAYAIDGAGNTIYGSEKSFVCANPAIGSPYQGGVLAYVFQSGDPGYIVGQFHGIVAAWGDAPKSATEWTDFWCSLKGTHTTSVGAFEIGLGSIAVDSKGGKYNTDLMNAGGWVGGQFISYMIEQFNLKYGNGFTDWVIPSINELILLKAKKSEIGGFSPTDYWSSSECVDTQAQPADFPPNWGFPTNTGYAWYLYFGDASVSQVRAKNNDARIRPIRYF